MTRHRHRRRSGRERRSGRTRLVATECFQRLGRQNLSLWVVRAAAFPWEIAHCSRNCDAIGTVFLSSPRRPNAAPAPPGQEALSSPAPGRNGCDRCMILIIRSFRKDLFRIVVFRKSGLGGGSRDRVRPGDASEAGIVYRVAVITRRHHRGEWPRWIMFSSRFRKMRAARSVVGSIVRSTGMGTGRGSALSASRENRITACGEFEKLASRWDKMSRLDGPHLSLA